MNSSKAISFVSLGCPKALVDSEHIVTGLMDSGYDVVGEHDAAQVVVVNTCGFIDSAKQESMEVIASALDAGREVVVTGCMGADAEQLRTRFPALKFISGPAESAPVIEAVRSYIPPSPQPDASTLAHEARVRLTPPHYAYLKISEGCNHTCSFCIIPSMRGKLRSRSLVDLLAEARQLAEAGVQELLVIAQDLSAYGVDLGYPEVELDGRKVRTDLATLCEVLGDIIPWVRLHYVYPYPNVDRLIPLMAQGRLLPYLDMPLQHAAPDLLRQMRRPAAAEKTLARISRWRELCPDLAIRSTFIVGFPGETEDDVGVLLDFLEAAQLDRVGCFTYSAVDGAAANDLPDHIDERDKLDRQEAVYETQAGISAARLQRHVGQKLRVIVDEVEAGDTPGQSTVIGRTMYDAPEIDGIVNMTSAQPLSPGRFSWVQIEGHDEHDLHGVALGESVDIR